jgi:hypothetical protein
LSSAERRALVVFVLPRPVALAPGVVMIPEESAARH